VKVSWNSNCKRYFIAITCELKTSNSSLGYARQTDNEQICVK